MSMLRMQKRSDRTGAAIVEFALVLPLFVIIVLGTIEACSMIFLQQSLEVAAYEGARAAIIPESTSGNVQASAALQLTGRGVKDFAVSVAPGNFGSQPYGTFVRVRVTAPCNVNGLLVSPIYRNRILTADVEMMLEH